MQQLILFMNQSTSYVPNRNTELGWMLLIYKSLSNHNICGRKFRNSFYWYQKIYRYKNNL